MVCKIQVNTQKEIKMDKSARCHVLVYATKYNTSSSSKGWWFVLLVESAVRGIVRCGERWVERFEDAVSA